MVLALAHPDLGHLGVRALHRRVRAFMLADLNEGDLVSWVIAYSDPTGETAVANVMREGAR